ncbi:MAG: O-antigen ligase family protein [Pseudomonadota bacterium]
MNANSNIIYPGFWFVLTGLILACFLNGALYTPLLYTLTILLVSLPGLAMLARSGTLPPWTTTCTLIAAYCAWAYISLFWSQAKLSSAIAVALPLALIGAFFSTKALITGTDKTAPWHPGAKAALAGRLIFTATVIATLPLVEFLITGNTRNGGAFLDDNTAVSIYSLPAFWATFTLLSSQERDRRTLLASAVLFIACLAILFSQSRAGIVAIALSFVISCLFMFRGDITGKIQLRGALLVALVSMASLLTFDKMTGDGIYSYLDRAGRLVGESSELNYTPRTAMAQGALRAAQAHPLLGTGYGTYNSAYKKFRPRDELIQVGAHAHNDYVEHLAEGGPVFLLLLLSIGGVLIFRLLQQTKSPTGMSATLALSAWGLYLLIHAFFNFLFYIIPTMIVLGIVLALLDHTPEKPGKKLGRLYAFILLSLTTLHGLDAYHFAYTENQLPPVIAPDFESDSAERGFNLFYKAFTPLRTGASQHLSAQFIDTARSTAEPGLRNYYYNEAQREICYQARLGEKGKQLFARLATVYHEAPTVPPLCPDIMPTDKETALALSIAEAPYEDLVNYKLLIDWYRTKGQEDQAGELKETLGDIRYAYGEQYHFFLNKLRLEGATNPEFLPYILFANNTEARQATERP